jgi:hypothetical protein
LSFELLRPTFLKSVHDVPWQVRSSHLVILVKLIARDEARARRGPWDAVNDSTCKGLPGSIRGDEKLRPCLTAPLRRSDEFDDDDEDPLRG